MKRDDVTSEHQGTEMINAEGMSLLFGVTEAEIIAEFDRQDVETSGVFHPPEEWLKRGRRRTKEYSAATGRTDVDGALEYWASRAGEVGA